MQSPKPRDDSASWYFVAMAVLLAGWAGALIAAAAPLAYTSRIPDTLGLFGVAALAFALQLAMEAKQ